ncbi:hypothetical protein [Rhodomicrobium lacus]|uniref:hypothetical protein n=1 Tax=Rhodomicrobium lacus TaxID=2498452 RepID=UPI0026E42F9D|nr:hypothetical protein [Rhodomicrobium lacus]WKW51490.1 hypothetical protein QMO75_03090 [Rhodomicrobium lacus]
MTETAPQAPVAPVNATEIEKAFKNPALFVNRAYLTLSGPNARLSFVEIAPDGTPLPRAAVAMTIADLFALHDAIGAIRQSANVVQIRQD